MNTKGIGHIPYLIVVVFLVSGCSAPPEIEESFKLAVKDMKSRYSGLKSFKAKCFGYDKPRDYLGTFVIEGGKLKESKKSDKDCKSYDIRIDYRMELKHRYDTIFGTEYYSVLMCDKSPRTYSLGRIVSSWKEKKIPCSYSAP